MTDHTHRIALERGLRWLFETEQPADAIISHHGIMLVSGARQFTFIPSGADRRPVVVVEVPSKLQKIGLDSKPVNPLRPGELEELAAWLTEHGYPVDKTWNGQVFTGSVGLMGDAHPTLVAAVNRYGAGCPAHPERSVFCDCGWYQAGMAQVVRPEPIPEHLQPCPSTITMPGTGVTLSCTIYRGHSGDHANAADVAPPDRQWWNDRGELTTDRHAWAEETVDVEVTVRLRLTRKNVAEWASLYGIEPDTAEAVVRNLWDRGMMSLLSNGLADVLDLTVREEV